MAVYALSLTQAGSICMGESCQGWTPISMLLLGFTQFFSLSSFGAGIAWFANFALFAAWLLSFLPRFGRAFISSCCALLMALPLLVTRHVLVSESGASEYITSFASGYWLWIGSMGLMVLSTLLSDTSGARSKILAS
jgi:hypothetical protein